MFFDYGWVKEYLEDAPSLEEAAKLLNLTGLETEAEEGGLEIEHTVNRPDAMSHFGVARELSVKLGAGLRHPEVYVGSIPPLEGWTVTSCDAEMCPRYMALYFENVKATPSPSWLVDRLTAIGQTCHNVLVDLTNFLLWEYGHPSHAFDAQKLKGRSIRVRFGEKGERLTTLDGRDHGAEDMLCIADGEWPVAFAGVMGGANSEVDDTTTSLLLELACFHGPTVRRTGRQNNIESDARHRFERGVDRENMDRILRRFAFLLLREQPKARIVGLNDMDIDPFKRKAVRLRRDRLRRLLGIEIVDQRVTDLLVAMDFRPEPHAEGWDLLVPGYKVDVEREIDVIEEVIRFAGLDLLNTELPAFGGTGFKLNPLRDGANRIMERLASFGFQETCTYSFLPETWDRQMAAQGEPVRLQNPMSENQAVMRRNMLPNMLECVRKNVNRGLQELGFFEIGHVFQGDQEPQHLGVVLTAGKDKSHWWQAADAHPFFRVKGVFEALQAAMGWQGFRLEEPAPPYLKTGEAMGIYRKDRMLGGLGILAPKTAGIWDLEIPVAVMELDLSFLREMPPLQYSENRLSEHPGIRIDMSFVVDRDHAYRTLRDHVLALEPENLEDLELFDVFEGKSIGSGKRSLGFRFKFQASDRTLTHDEVSQTMDRVVESVKHKFGAIVRI